ncbi:ABC transporter permease (plasmid) [Deinococcus psychrotolerans]|uniref:ABC transporter permease n=1 Tax=Deinococcus psychrotolerans TaxID=2489213 RepID=A0A3G8YJB1_9DEIO|nr:ABC transporter permease [Deinococcus psychrotolerans]AZI44995.1 ABC transporter permease [Deinococcus psychrotolerans]
MSAAPISPGRSRPSGRMFGRFTRHRLAFVSLLVLAVLVLVGVFAPLLAPYDPYNLATSTSGNILFASPPSREFWLGTDALGRDVLSRLIFGTRVSLTIGISAAALALVIGVVLGVIAGFRGHLTDTLLSRFTDAVAAFPSLFLILTVSSFVKPSLITTVAIIGLLSWVPTYRLMRGETLKLRHLDYVEAAGALGAGDPRLMFRHILPNAAAPIIVQTTLGVADAILTESALSFLGLGVQQPVASWGNMLADARTITVLQSQPWLWLPPGLAILVTLLAINFLGDGLRDTFNPRER